MKSLPILISALATSCASHMGKLKFDETRQLPYAESSDRRQLADVYVPHGDGIFPGVILVHGGGWKSRDKSDMAAVAKSLASHGLVVLNINYRFAPEHKHPAPIEDLEAAVKYFRKYAAKFKLDSNRIGLWGYSSGGHTVSYYALTRANIPGLQVNAVVAGGAPYDFTWYSHSPYIKGYMGKYRDEMLNEYFEASSTSKITKASPPFFLYHAENDKLVEYAQAMAFEAKLKSQGVYVKSYRVPFWGHAMAFALSDRAVEKGIVFLRDQLRK